MVAMRIAIVVVVVEYAFARQFATVNFDVQKALSGQRSLPATFGVVGEA
jgi:hypothetical protein